MFDVQAPVHTSANSSACFSTRVSAPLQQSGCSVSPQIHCSGASMSVTLPLLPPEVPLLPLKSSDNRRCRIGNLTKKPSMSYPETYPPKTACVFASALSIGVPVKTRTPPRVKTILTRIKICGCWSNKEKGFQTHSPQPHPPRRDSTKLHARQYRNYPLTRMALTQRAFGIAESGFRRRIPGTVSRIKVWLISLISLTISSTRLWFSMAWSISAACSAPRPSPWSPLC